MFAFGVISFRETLEAAFVVGIILSFLAKTKQNSFQSFVWRGVLCGVALAVIVGEMLDMFLRGLADNAEPIFEGILMFVTASLLTWMILWVHRQKEAVKIKEKAAKYVGEGYGLGIFFLVGTSVFREGIETVLYLKAISLSGLGSEFLGVLLGIIAAILVSLVLFTFTIRIRLDIIFHATSILLLLFAAGLVSYGVHEFQEVGFLPTFRFDPIVNMSSILDNTSLLGSLLRALFGYTSKPTLLEAVSYGCYILFIVWFKKLTDKKISNLISN